jgi:putative transposase
MLPGPWMQEGFKVGRLHVATLMKRREIRASYRKPNTSKSAPEHKIYHYRKLPINVSAVPAPLIVRISDG